MSEKIELRDVEVVPTPDEDDTENDSVAFRAYATGPNGQRFYSTVKVRSAVVYRPEVFDEFVRGTLEENYKHLTSGWEADLAERAANLFAGQYLTAPRCYFEPNARKFRFPSGGDADDITVEAPASPPADLDAAASELVSRYAALLPHRTKNSG